MTLDSAIAAAERTATARHLIAQAQVEVVDLVIVSALDLCVLDGPRQPVIEERVAQAWQRMTGRQRGEVTEQVTADLVRRGLLIEDSPEYRARQPGDSYSLKPELGLTLAARCRPVFIVVAKGERRDLRPLCLFALGDQADPVQAIVAELPAGLPPGRATARPGRPLPRYPQARAAGLDLPLRPRFAGRRGRPPRQVDHDPARPAGRSTARAVPGIRLPPGS